jgi:excisionase family DNA binding protein
MIRLKELERWLSTGQAARVLGCSRPHVIKLAQLRRVQAVKTAAGWLYDPRSVEKLREERLVENMEVVEGSSVTPNNLNP